MAWHKNKERQIEAQQKQKRPDLEGKKRKRPQFFNDDGLDYPPSNDWPEYERLPLIIKATEVTKPQILDTVDGRVNMQLGDVIINDPKKGFYKINAETFKQTYNKKVD